jgi:3-hydroxyisobutyrate dehydrogenase
VPQIAFAGLGRMGLAMCAALVRAGYQVIATDNRPEAEEATVACGAVWQDTPAQAAAAAGVLITMLPGSGEVRVAMLGEAGALKGLAAGATWIDMTSSSPAAIRPIREQAMKQEVEVLEAPVGGECPYVACIPSKGSWRPTCWAGMNGLILSPREPGMRRSS